MLNHHRIGAGPPLLLLHGIGMRWQWWNPCLAGLGARHDVVAVDFPGFGASAPLARGDDPTPARLAAEVEALVAELGLGRPHVAGISMGGQIALELVRRESVASATAISPGGFYRGWERGWVRATLAATFLSTTRVLAPRAEAILGRPRARTAVMGQVCAHGSRIPPAELAGHLRSLAASDFARTLPVLLGAPVLEPIAASVPVTIAWGSRDLLLFPHQADRAVELVRGARKVVLRGASHVPTYDDPDATVAAVLGTTGA